MILSMCIGRKDIQELLYLSCHAYNTVVYTPQRKLIVMTVKLVNQII